VVAVGRKERNYYDLVGFEVVGNVVDVRRLVHKDSTYLLEDAAAAYPADVFACGGGAVRVALRAVSDDGKRHVSVAVSGG